MAKKKFEIICPFDSEEFYSVWELWLQYRSDINKPYKSEISVQAIFKKLSKYSEDVAIKMLIQSMENSWQGIFELKNELNKQESKIDKFADEAMKGRELLKQMQNNDSVNNN